VTGHPDQRLFPQVMTKCECLTSRLLAWPSWGCSPWPGRLPNGPRRGVLRGMFAEVVHRPMGMWPRPSRPWAFTLPPRFLSHQTAAEAW